jgi:hypothetical protein
VDGYRTGLSQKDWLKPVAAEEANVAIQGPYKVDCAELFPYGVGIVGAVVPLDDFDASTRQNKVQARDKDTGLPMWSVDVIDFDPEARDRTFKIKIAAAVQPVPPEPVPGTPLRPVLLEGLTVTPYIKEGKFPKIGYSLRATGLVSPRRAAVDQGKAA